MRCESARQILRERTHAAHERLHHLPAFAALAAGTLDRDGYVALLGRLYGFHAPIEAALATALGGERGALAPAGWRRADLLRADLRHLGAGDGGPLPMLAPPALPSRAAAIGWLYVVEGSTLGGRVLARALDRLLPEGSADGRRFLGAGQAPDHPRWAAIGVEIDRCGASPPELDRMIAAAHECFARFDLWFSETIAI